MAHPALERVAERFPEMEQALEEAKDLIDAMREAGEDVKEVESLYREQQLSVNRWRVMLKARGLLK